MKQDIKFRNSFILLVLLTTSILACKTAAERRGTFKIIGHIEGLKSDSVYLYNTISNQMQGTAVNEGDFLITGKVIYPEMYQLYFDVALTKFKDLFLENSTITINGNIDSLENIQIKGSASNVEYLEYRDNTQKVRKDYYKLDSILSVAMDNLQYEMADSIELLATAAAHRVLECAYKYALEHKKSVILPYITYMSCLNAPDKSIANKMVDLIQPGQIKSARIDALNKMFADMERTSVGSVAPDFEMTGMNGRKIKLSSYRGKVVLLDFWASWCNPCIKGFPELEEVYKKFKNDKFEIIGFSIDKDKAAWEKSLAKYHLPWPQVVELNGAQTGAPKDYGILFIPATYLIDKDGKIAGKNLHGKKLLNRITPLINE